MMLTGVGSASAIATVAGAISAVANMGAQHLAKPPAARGSVSQIIVQPDAPQPYVMGEGYFAGVLRHDTGYGGTVDDVVNPYRFMPVVYSGGGPIQSITPQVDYSAVGSYYTGWLYTSTQLGATPEAAALGHSLGSTPPGWGSAYKLSGQAAIGWNFKFDKKGKKFASGLPLLGAIIQGVKVYDPRLDSTFPGGSGTHRLGDESTYTYSANPALHAGTYAHGRYQNAKRVLGIGLPSDGIDWETVAAWANVCDLNSWTMFGVAYEPGDKGQNLRDICAAGGAEPVFANAVLSFRYSAPAVALDTISEEDIADEPGSVTFMQSYRDRLNTIVPKYRSPDHNWEMVNAEPVQVPTYLAEDGGEERREEWPFNFVKSASQAAQLAAYRLVDSRELHPIQLVCKPRLRAYRPGDCLRVDQPQLGLDTDAIVISRSIDPATMKVTLTLIGETPSKHAYALGLTGTPPETPALGQTGEEADTVAAESGARLLISRSTNYPTSSDDTSISVVAFTGVTQDGLSVSFPASTISSLTAGSDYVVLYDLETLAYSAVLWPATTEMADRKYVYIGRQLTSDGGVYEDPETPPPGYCVADDTPILLPDGTEIPAGELVPGTVVRTQHEYTLAWGDWPVLAIAFHDEEVFACDFDGLNGAVTIRATAKHRFLIDRRWVTAKELGTPDGTARVAKITVSGAHTYISAGVLSHNAKMASN